MERLRVASLFCGCGGTDCGMEGGFHFLGNYYHENQINIVYANDFEKSACDLYNENFNLRCEHRDIREIEASEIPDHDILTGGFPCQSFSIVAQNPKRLGYKNEKGMLFFEMCRVLREKQPKCFIAENVKGILSANKKEAFPLILDELEKSGYNVTYDVLNSADYGIPQKRERVFIVGFRKDLLVDFKFPKPIVNSSGYTPLSTVLIPEEEIIDKYYFSERAVQGMLKARHKMNKGRAQNINGPCNTVGAHLAKVSLNSTDPVLKINERYRRFTPREVARIQSFPEEYALIGSESSQYKALGNAIPPVVMWHITKQLVTSLKNATKIEDDK